MFISKFASKDIEKQIEKYEDKIGKKLPEQYREFLCKYNGGETPHTSFKTDEVASDVKAFYGLENKKYPLNKIKPKEEGNTAYLPIACDSFGNEIILDFVDGEIHFWDHENGKITKLKDSLKEFFDICVSESIKNIAVKSVEEREADLIKRGRGSIITEELREMWRAEIEKNSSIKLEEVLL